MGELEGRHIHAKEVAVQIPTVEREIGVGPRHERIGGQEVAARMVAFGKKRKHAVAAAAEHGERPAGGLHRPEAMVGECVGNLNGALAEELDFNRLLNARLGLDWLGEGDAVFNRLERAGLVVGLVSANEVLGRVPEAVASA